MASRKNIYGLKSGLVIEKSGDEIVIFDSDRSVLITLNESASAYFTYIQNSTSKSSIIDRIVATYQISKETASHDLEEVLSRMKKAGLLTV